MIQKSNCCRDKSEVWSTRRKASLNIPIPRHAVPRYAADLEPRHQTSPRPSLSPTTTPDPIPFSSPLSNHFVLLSALPSTSPQSFRTLIRLPEPHAQKRTILLLPPSLPRNLTILERPIVPALRPAAAQEGAAPAVVTPRAARHLAAVPAVETARCAFGAGAGGGERAVCGGRRRW